MQIYKCDPCLLPDYYGFNYANYKSLAEKAFLFTGFLEKTMKPTMAVVIMIRIHHANI